MCLSDVARIVDHDPATYDALVEIDGRSANVSTIALGLDCPGLAAGDWIVVFNGPETLTGEFTNVKIERVSPLTLFGRLT